MASNSLLMYAVVDLAEFDVGAVERHVRAAVEPVELELAVLRDQVVVDFQAQRSWPAETGWALRSTGVLLPLYRPSTPRVRRRRRVGVETHQHAGRSTARRLRGSCTPRTAARATPSRRDRSLVARYSLLGNALRMIDVPHHPVQPRFVLAAQAGDAAAAVDVAHAVAEADHVGDHDAARRCWSGC